MGAPSDGSRVAGRDDLGHYVQNIGSGSLRYLEIFRSDHFADLSLTQWLGLIPPELVRQHLNVDDAFISKLTKNKPILVK